MADISYETTIFGMNIAETHKASSLIVISSLDKTNAKLILDKDDKATNQSVYGELNITIKDTELKPIEKSDLIYKSEIEADGDGDGDGDYRYALNIMITIISDDGDHKIMQIDEDLYTDDILDFYIAISEETATKFKLIILLTDKNICSMKYYNFICNIIDMLYKKENLIIYYKKEIIFNEGKFLKTSAKFECEGVALTCKNGLAISNNTTYTYELRYIYSEIIRLISVNFTKQATNYNDINNPHLQAEISLITFKNFLEVLLRFDYVLKDDNNNNELFCVQAAAVLSSSEYIYDTTEYAVFFENLDDDDDDANISYFSSEACELFKEVCKNNNIDIKNLKQTIRSNEHNLFIEGIQDSVTASIRSDSTTFPTTKLTEYKDDMSIVGDSADIIFTCIRIAYPHDRFGIKTKNAQGLTYNYFIFILITQLMAAYDDIIYRSIMTIDSVDYNATFENETILEVDKHNYLTKSYKLPSYPGTFIGKTLYNKEGPPENREDDDINYTQTPISRAIIKYAHNLLKNIKEEE